MSFSVIEKRFIKNTKKSKDCIIWKNKTSNGYGRFSVNGFRFLAHRFSYMIYNGSIEPNKFIHHKCNNKMCVNPEHLQQVTPKENTKIYYNGNGW